MWPQTVFDVSLPLDVNVLLSLAPNLLDMIFFHFYFSLNNLFPIFFNSLLFTLLHSSHCRITLKSSINYLQFFCISIFHNFDSVCLQTLSQMGTYSIRIQHKWAWLCLLWHMDCSQWNEWLCSSLSVSICSNKHSS